MYSVHVLWKQKLLQLHKPADKKKKTYRGDPGEWRNFLDSMVTVTAYRATCVHQLWLNQDANQMHGYPAADSDGKAG